MATAAIHLLIISYSLGCTHASVVTFPISGVFPGVFSNVITTVVPSSSTGISSPGLPSLGLPL